MKYKISPRLQTEISNKLSTINILNEIVNNNILDGASIYSYVDTYPIEKVRIEATMSLWFRCNNRLKNLMIDFNNTILVREKNKIIGYNSYKQRDNIVNLKPWLIILLNNENIRLNKLEVI